MYPIYSCLPLESIGQPFRKLFLYIFKPLCLCVLIMYQELAKAAQEPTVHICPVLLLVVFVPVELSHQTAAGLRRGSWQVRTLWPTPLHASLHPFLPLEQTVEDCTQLDSTEVSVPFSRFLAGGCQCRWWVPLCWNWVLNLNLKEEL